MAEKQQGKTHAEQNQSAQAQQPSPPAQTLVEPSNAAPYSDAEPGNAEQTPPEKPLPRFLRPEWIVVYITAVYVVITAFMLVVIKQQADQMERQTTIQAASVAAAQKSADAANAQIKAMKDKERARLSIREVVPPLLFLKDDEIKPDIPMVIKMVVINEGSSMAFNVRAVGHTSILEYVGLDELTSISDNTNEWYDLDIPKTIRLISPRPGIEVTVTHMSGVIDTTFEPIDRATAKALVMGQLSLTIGGEITYEDIFGDEHKTPFFFLWVVAGDEGAGTWRLGSNWLDLSSKRT